MDSGTPFAQEALELILRRLFRIALASALGRAFAQRSAKWLSVAGAITLLRIIDRRAARSGRTTKSRS
jgi:hypothetical protein